MLPAQTIGATAEVGSVLPRRSCRCLSVRGLDQSLRLMFHPLVDLNPAHSRLRAGWMTQITRQHHWAGTAVRRSADPLTAEVYFSTLWGVPLSSASSLSLPLAQMCLTVLGLHLLSEMPCGEAERGGRQTGMTGEHWMGSGHQLARNGQRLRRFDGEEGFWKVRRGGS
jgi:hypothetical protein